MDELQLRGDQVGHLRDGHHHVQQHHRVHPHQPRGHVGALDELEGPGMVGADVVVGDPLQTFRALDRLLHDQAGVLGVPCAVVHVAPDIALQRLHR
ncbi:hypothetical protein D3C72_2176150 [compost metagenome]